MKNIFHNFFPQQSDKVSLLTTSLDDWFHKNKIKGHAKLTNKYFNGGKKDSDLVQITSLWNECTKTILEAKEKYINQLSQNLIDTSAKPKTYWKIINRFVNNEKTPMISPLLINDKIIANFSEKAKFSRKVSFVSWHKWSWHLCYYKKPGSK